MTAAPTSLPPARTSLPAEHADLRPSPPPRFSTKCAIRDSRRSDISRST
jgi:hypothetical protein